MSGSARPLLIGIDTGGTYTDAVVYDERTDGVVATAKAPTTHDDLSVGIEGALDRVLDIAAVEVSHVRVVSLSTTLATNALVEDTGRPACLVAVGFDDDALDRAGLRTTLGSDALVRIAGGHTSHGTEAEELDLRALEAALDDGTMRCDAFAVTAQFSVRNPEHEIAVRDLLRERTGLPVTCSHELSARLNGPKRAVTALLNARLIALIDELVTTTAQILDRRSIDARLMVVRGDGSLVSAAFVSERPIETILSGPAASVIGASHLTSESDSMVVDIGGTTTDIAVVRAGVPTVRSDGAVVGGHHTMIDAVAMDTLGLGGDSRVDVAEDAVGAQLILGPRRIVPVSMLGMTEHDVVLATLERHAASDTPRPFDGRFVAPARREVHHLDLGRAETEVLDRIGDDTCALDHVIASRVDERAVDRLVSRGFLRLAGFTPTDAAHVLGLQTDLDIEAARAAAAVFARRRDRYGDAIAPTGIAVSEAVIARLVRASAEALLASAFRSDGLDASTASSPLVQAALDGRLAATRIDIGASLPIVAMGAPARSYYPMVAELLGTPVTIPDHAEVANAVGAAVGKVRLRDVVVISAPRRGIFRVHTDSPHDLRDLDEAKASAETHLRATIDAAMDRAGAAGYELALDWAEKTISVDDRPFFVEGTLRAFATGRPGDCTTR